MNTCSKCRADKPDSCFAHISARAGRQARLASWCNQCTNVHRKPAMKVPLTVEYLLESLHLDPATGVFTWKKRCNQLAIGAAAGGVDAYGYRVIKLGGRAYKAHRLAWFYVYGKWPAGQIDHINGDKQDNRLCNLRDATHAVNQHNRPARRDSSTGVRGVAPHQGRWRATIKANGQRHSIGVFDDFNSAVMARREAEKTYHPTKPTGERP